MLANLSTIVIGILTALGAGGTFGYSVPTISPWMYFGGGTEQIRTVSSSTQVIVGANATTTDSALETPSLTITDLTSEDCIGTDANGVVESGTCGGGGGGDVSKVGTPVDNQVGVWTGDGTIEGDTALTFDGTELNVLSTGTQLSLSYDGSNSTDINTNTNGDLFFNPSGEDSFFDSDVHPLTGNTRSLGTIGAYWSDLYIGSGGTINFNNNVELTHSAGNLTLSNGDVFNASDAIFSTATSTTLCLTGDDCITTWPSGTSVSFGSDNQIPFTNSGGTDFDYATAFVFDGTNLGIGTSSPSHLLTLGNPVSVIGSGARLAAFNAGNTYALFKDSEDDIEGHFGTHSDGYVQMSSATDHPLRFRIDNDGAAMVIATTSNVGIGIASPDRRLEITDSTGPQIRLSYTSGSVYTDVRTLDNGDLDIVPTGGNVLFNSAYAFPSSDGTTGQVLTTNGSGAVTFQDPAGGSGTGGLATTSPFTAGDLVQVSDNGTVNSIATSSLGLLTTNVAEGSNLYFTNERAQDQAGGMFSGNTETLITVTYQDGDGTIDFVVDDDLSNYDNTTSAFLTGVAWGDITGTLSNQTDLQNALDAKASLTTLASTANGNGASLIGIEDSAGDFTATDVEGALAELFALGESLGSSISNLELSDLTDVGATTATNRNVLVADGDSWESRALVEADISDLGSYLDASDIGSSVQAYDADLDTYAGITPSANVQSLLGAASYAAMRTQLDLEAGTDFYSIAAADAAFEGELDNSAGLRAALSDEVGTGAAYFVGGALGTPASGNGSNLTALNATQLTTGTIPAGRVGTAHIDTATEIGNDIITHAQIVDADQADTKCAYIETPTEDDDLESIWANKTSNDFLITEIWGESDQTVNFDLQIDDGSPADVSGTDISPAGGEDEDTSLAGDTTLAAGEELDLAITSVSGDPTWVSICWTGNWID